MSRNLALEPRSREQIAIALGAVRHILGSAALAVYLYGSAVAGGLRLHSDLDLLVISERSLIADEQAALATSLLTISGHMSDDGPARPLELSIVAKPAVNPWRYPPNIEFQFGEWMRPSLERGELPTWPHPDPDVAVLIETAFRGAIPLLGPPITELLEPIPRVDLHRALLDTIPILIPGIVEGDDRRNGLLTLARIWVTLAIGEIRPKDQAAEWALARLPEKHRPVLAHARAAYLGEEHEDWRAMARLVRPHIEHVVEEIRALPNCHSGEGDSATPGGE